MTRAEQRSRIRALAEAVRAVAIDVLPRHGVPPYHYRVRTTEPLGGLCGLAALGVLHAAHDAGFNAWIMQGAWKDTLHLRAV